MSFLRVAFLGFALAVGVLVGTADAAPKVERVTSPGGIEAWLVPAHEIPVIAVEVAFRGGASFDPPGKPGTASLLASLLDEGAGELDSKAFQTRLEDLNIRMSFGAGDDALSASMSTLTDTRDEAFRLLGLALTSPRLDPEPIERMRQSRLVGLAAEEEYPGTVAAKAWDRAVYGDHPYAEPTQGTLASLPTITRDDLAAYAKGRIARDVLLVIVVGDIDAATLGPLLDKTFGALPANSAPGEVGPASFGPPRTEVIRRAVPQSVVRFGLPGISRQDPDWYAASVLNYALGGGGFESRLMREVRVKRGLAYGISTYLISREHAAVLIGQVGTANASVGKAMDVIRQELGRMAKDGLDDQELADAKTYLTGSFPLNLDSNGAIAGVLMQLRRDRLPIDQLERRTALINAVTREDVGRVAKRLLDPDRLVTVVVGEPQGVTPSNQGG
jgi:zinc protease